MTTTNTIALLERGRMRIERQSKRGLAIRLGMEDANLRRIYRGKGFPNNVHCERLAELIGMEPIEVMRYVQEDKTKNEADKEFLRAKLPRLLPTTGLALAWIVGASLTQIHEARSESTGSQCDRSIHYAQWLARRVARWLRGAYTRVSQIAIALDFQNSSHFTAISTTRRELALELNFAQL